MERRHWKLLSIIIKQVNNSRISGVVIPLDRIIALSLKSKIRISLRPLFLGDHARGRSFVNITMHPPLEYGGIKKPFSVGKQE
jgi:hypothetical protein